MKIDPKLAGILPSYINRNPSIKPGDSDRNQIRVVLFNTQEEQQTMIAKKRANKNKDRLLGFIWRHSHQ